MQDRVFKAGDQVMAIDEDFQGIVVSVSEDVVGVESVDGFTLTFKPRELLKIEGTEDLEVSPFAAAQARAMKEDEKKKPKSRPTKRKDRNQPPLEVDLHIHQLKPNTRGWSNHEMLNLQLETVKRQLDFARRKNIRRVVFIHGKGEGVLREELKYLLRRYDDLKFYDADWQKYGGGATEVYLYQNP